MPAPTYTVGELVTYYPRRLNKDDNRHWPAAVLAVRHGRYLVEIDAPPPAGSPARHVAPACPAG